MGNKTFFLLNIMALIFNLTRVDNPNIHTFLAGLNLGFVFMFSLILWYQK